MCTGLSYLQSNLIGQGVFADWANKNPFLCLIFFDGDSKSFRRFLNVDLPNFARMGPEKERKNFKNAIFCSKASEV